MAILKLDLRTTIHPCKGKHLQKKSLAFCNIAALMSALFIVGQVIQSSTSEETRLAAAAILLQCQNTKKEWYSAANQFQSAFWIGISCTLYTVCSHNAPKWPNREGPELGQIMSWGALPPLSAAPPSLLMASHLFLAQPCPSFVAKFCKHGKQDQFKVEKRTWD